MAQINFRDKCREGAFDLLSFLAKEQNGGYRWRLFLVTKTCLITQTHSYLIASGSRNNHNLPGSVD